MSWLTRAVRAPLSAAALRLGVSIALTTAVSAGALSAACHEDVLRVLGLDGNQFSGPLPASIGDLANLEELGLAYNGFTGALPAEPAHLVKGKSAA